MDVVKDQGGGVFASVMRFSFWYAVLSVFVAIFALPIEGRAHLGVIETIQIEQPLSLTVYKNNDVLKAETKDLTDRKAEADRLSQQGIILTNQAQYLAALEFFQQSLAIRQETGDRSGAGTMLNNIGFIYSSLGQYPKALEF